MKRRKPDLLMVLALVLGVGVIITSYATLFDKQATGILAMKFPSIQKNPTQYNLR